MSFQYYRFAPAAALEPFVDCYWALRSQADLPTGIPERIVPDGCFELIFNFGSRHRHYNQRDLQRFSSLGSSILIGQRTRYFHTELAANSSEGLRAVGIRLRPEGLYPLCGMLAGEIVDEVIPLDAVWGAAVAETEEQLLAARSPDRLPSLLDAFLLGRPDLRRQAHPGLDAAIRRIRQCKGHLRIDALAAELNLSIKQLERLFKGALGVSPKRYARIMKFSDLHAWLDRPDASINWAAVAAAMNYYDQNHFIKNFKEFSGLLPGEYLKELREQGGPWT